MYDSIVSYLALVLLAAIPLIVTALGGMFTERGGVTNISLEGIMIIGAFVGLVTVNKLPASWFSSNFVLYLCGMIAAVIGGLIFAGIHAIAAIKMKANQIISATAINTLAPALALFLTMSLTLGEAQGSDKILVNGTRFIIERVPLLADIPFIGEVFFTNVYPSLYFGIAILVISSIVLYKTKFGLRLRACGENPHAADAAGINIYKMRYQGVFISGILASLGGYFLVTSFTNEFDATVSGFGFLAIAVMIFGNWKPKNIAFTALFFAALLTLSKGVAFFPALENWLYPPIPADTPPEQIAFLTYVSTKVIPNIISMLPYIATLAVLVLSSKKSAAPKASGLIYDKGER
ncbi:MAG: ABC transporter permease [Candidatus Izemoplasmatales bacterium]|jgi:simple sugar transport system permease protein|nr:ABC transporter permease [Candidatus Izemoplasmatales bacterium]MDD3864948.1 ABC transporter permease [Candidatus Izemoplasmatales bacterium]